MSSEIESIIDELLNHEINIFRVTILNKNGTLITQTEKVSKFLLKNLEIFLIKNLTKFFNLEIFT